MSSPMSRARSRAKLSTVPRFAVATVDLDRLGRSGAPLWAQNASLDHGNAPAPLNSIDRDQAAHVAFS